MEIEELLSLNGFTLHRNNKHRVYKNEKGITYVMSNTPSDRYAENQQVREFYKVMHRHNLVVLEEKPRKEIPVDNFNPPKIIIETPKKQPTKYWDEESDRIIDAGKAEGKTQAEIAAILSALGYVTRTGKPVKLTDVQNRVFTRRRAAEKPSKTEAKRSNFLHDVTEIISSNLSDEMKERMIRQLL